MPEHDINTSTLRHQGLYPCEVEIARRLSQSEKHSGRIAPDLERQGLQKIDPIMKGRFWSAVEAFFCSPGWAIPEGLRRHLEGVGNTGECDVAKALRHMAANALRNEFARVDQAAAALEAARRRDERTYLTDPRLPPRFSDEPGDFHLDTPRTAEQLAAAEERLRELGFAAEADGNVVARKYRQEPYTVLADPRAAGRLRFRVYNETRIAPARRKGGRRLGSWASAFSVPLMAEFYLLDSWRNDIVGKFRTGCSRRLQPSAGTARRVIAATNDHWHADANGGNVGQRNE